ncbi:hypothetical protein RRF57_002819 [Xylaria bambusicola]|uniref:Uncharacterized protein n=1 Tax=Xylaria bambusicola TaxID=326684 RepID=A0AAN7UJK6_9PEZI
MHRSEEGAGGSLQAAETELAQKLGGLGPTISQFPEGLRVSFERRMCVTKNGYISQHIPRRRCPISHKTRDEPGS